MKSPIDTPQPDPVVTKESNELDDLLEIDSADSRQEPHLSAARLEGVMSDPQ